MSAPRQVAYSFDTSALIDPWRRLYPPDVFPRVWDAMSVLLASGAVIASDMVRRDFEKKHGDDLHAWVDEHASMIFLADTPLIQRHVREVLTKHPKLASASHGHSDPFVIAHAIQTSATVVTNKRKRSLANPKIPMCATRWTWSASRRWS